MSTARRQRLRANPEGPTASVARVLDACAAARSVLSLMPRGEDRPRRAVEAAERWARGAATSAELTAAYRAAINASTSPVGWKRAADLGAIYHAARAAASAAAAAVSAANGGDPTGPKTMAESAARAARGAAEAARGPKPPRPRAPADPPRCPQEVATGASWARSIRSSWTCDSGLPERPR